MCRSPCCSKQRINRGAWTKTEDMTLSNYIRIHGYGRWRDLPQKAGLSRCGKSCRFRWMNYLRPDIKLGNISPDEEELIIKMHRLLGNRFSLIAGRLPGRTNNEIKNYWNTHLRKKISTDECQNKTLNLKTSAESRPLRNVVFKTTPVKITPPVRYYGMLAPNRCCSNIGNSDFASKKFNIQETTNSSEPCCDPFLKNSDTEDDSESAPFRMSDTNLVETEADLQPSHSNHFTENAATIDDILFDLNQFLFSTSFGLEDFHSGPATLDEGMTELQYQSNMQQENSFTVTDDPRIKEIYDSTEPVDWKHLLSHVLN